MPDDGICACFKSIYKLLVLFREPVPGSLERVVIELLRVDARAMQYRGVNDIETSALWGGCEGLDCGWCRVHGLTTGVSDSAARTAFMRAKTKLMDINEVREFGGYVWRVSDDD